MEIQRDGKPVEVECYVEPNTNRVLDFGGVNQDGYKPYRLTAEEKTFVLNLALNQLERKP